MPGPEPEEQAKTVLFRMRMVDVATTGSSRKIPRLTL
jgi:hypothetical protein